MGTSLIGLLPQNTYSGLIKVGNNTALNTTLKTLSDGAGNDLPMQASTTAINFTGTVSGVASGVSGAIQFSDGSAFASDATNFFWDDTNNRLGIGTNAPISTLQVVGNAFVQYGGGSTDGSLQVGTNGGGIILSSANRTDVSLKTNAIMTTRGTGITFRSTAGEPNYAILGVVGSGSTSATTSLLVQNSGGTAAVTVKDDLSTTFGGNISASNLTLSNGGFIYAGTQLRIGAGAITILSDSANAINFAAGASGRSFGVSSAVNGAPNSTAFLFVGDTATGVTMGSNSNSHASAVLDLVSTTKGFLPPRMTTTQKNAIASPAEGLQMYDSTAKSPAYYDGTNWGYTGGALQNAAGNSGTLNISFAAGNIVNLTLNANTTLAFSNAVIGTYIIQVTQGATGANVLTYPASVKWSGGTAPTLTTTVGKTDILTFYYDGTNFFGTYSLNY